MRFGVYAAVAVATATVVSAVTTMGCVSPVPLAVPVDNSATPALCQASCSRNGWAYCFYHQPSGACYGGAIPPGPGAAASGPAEGNCAPSIFSIVHNAWKMSTTFAFQTCSSGWQPAANDPPKTTNPLNIETCFSDCRYYRYAIAKPGLFTFTCTCLNLPPTITGSTGTCSSSTNFIYNHPLNAAVSGLVRRKERAQQVAIPSCPPPLSACLIAPNEYESFECINPDYELESCGGCRYGSHGPQTSLNATIGEDCTARTGVLPGGVTCSEGKCLVSHCRNGFRLVDGQCI